MQITDFLAGGQGQRCGEGQVQALDPPLGRTRRTRGRAGLTLSQQRRTSTLTTAHPGALRKERSVCTGNEHNAHVEEKRILG